MLKDIDPEALTPQGKIHCIKSLENQLEYNPMGDETGILKSIMMKNPLLILLFIWEDLRENLRLEVMVFLQS